MGTALIERAKNLFRPSVPDFDLSKIIQGHRNAVRDRRYLPFGKVQAIRFDVSSEAPYNSFRQAAEVGSAADEQNVRMRNRMLFFDWDMEHAPLIGQAGKEFVFPVGIENPPRQAVGGINQLVDDKHPPVYVQQDLLDHADGYIEDNRGGDAFVVIHPIIAFVTLVQGAFVLLKGFPDLDGRRPALLYNPITKEAHFVGGQLLPEKST